MLQPLPRHVLALSTLLAVLSVVGPANAADTFQPNDVAPTVSEIRDIGSDQRVPMPRADWMEDVACLDSGSCLAMWQHEAEYNDVLVVREMRPNGTLGPRKGVSTIGRIGSAELATNGSEYLAAWDTEDEIRAARLDSTGAAVGSTVDVQKDVENARLESLTFGASRYFAVWSTEPDVSESGPEFVKSTRIDDTGTVLNRSSPTLVYDARPSSRFVAGYDGDTYLVVWETRDRSGRRVLMGSRVEQRGGTRSRGQTLRAVSDHPTPLGLACRSGNCLLMWEISAELRIGTVDRQPNFEIGATRTYSTASDRRALEHGDLATTSAGFLAYWIADIQGDHSVVGHRLSDDGTAAGSTAGTFGRRGAEEARVRVAHGGGRSVAAWDFADKNNFEESYDWRETAGGTLRSSNGTPNKRLRLSGRRRPQDLRNIAAAGDRFAALWARRFPEPEVSTDERPPPRPGMVRIAPDGSLLDMSPVWLDESNLEARRRTQLLAGPARWTYVGYYEDLSDLIRAHRLDDSGSWVDSPGSPLFKLGDLDSADTGPFFTHEVARAGERYVVVWEDITEHFSAIRFGPEGTALDGQAVQLAHRKEETDARSLASYNLECTSDVCILVWELETNTGTYNDEKVEVYFVRFDPETGQRIDDAAVHLKTIEDRFPHTPQPAVAFGPKEITVITPAEEEFLAFELRRTGTDEPVKETSSYPSFGRSLIYGGTALVYADPLYFFAWEQQPTQPKDSRSHLYGVRLDSNHAPVDEKPIRLSGETGTLRGIDRELDVAVGEKSRVGIAWDSRSGPLERDVRTMVRTIRLQREDGAQCEYDLDCRTSPCTDGTCGAGTAEPDASDTGIDVAEPDTTPQPDTDSETSPDTEADLHESFDAGTETGPDTSSGAESTKADTSEGCGCANGDQGVPVGGLAWVLAVVGAWHLRSRRRR